MLLSLCIFQFIAEVLMWSERIFLMIYDIRDDRKQCEANDGKGNMWAWHTISLLRAILDMLARFKMLDRGVEEQWP